jgi:predicted metalloprotease with PDZ domain
VVRGSAADRVGLRAGDVLRSVNGVSVASIADVQYGLHRAAAKGKVPVAWLRDGKTQTAELDLPEGWRQTNITWRPSLLDVLPAVDLEGEDHRGREEDLAASENSWRSAG